MPILLRADFDAGRLRQAARESADAGQVRRLLAMAAIYDGASRTEAAAIGGVTLQIVRDWVIRFNALGPAGLIDRKAPGKPSLLKANHRRALAEIVDAGPRACCAPPEHHHSGTGYRWELTVNSLRGFSHQGCLGLYGPT